MSKYRIIFETEEQLSDGSWKILATEDHSFDWYEDFHPTDEHVKQILDELYSDFNKFCDQPRRLGRIISYYITEVPFDDEDDWMDEGYDDNDEF